MLKCSFIVFYMSPQDIPLHAALLTHLLIAWDRMRWLNDPMSARFPAFVCSCATWLTGMVIALPYPIYTTYLDLGVSKTYYLCILLSKNFGCIPFDHVGKCQLVFKLFISTRCHGVWSSNEFEYLKCVVH